MKSVLMSIQPKWCELIASGKKTIEVRKTKPKLETPFKVYIYCTYGEGLIEANDEILPNHLIEQKVSKYKTWGNCCNGKVIGEFVCDEIFPIKVFENGSIQDYVRYDMEKSCVPYDAISSYIGSNKLGCAWNISNLVIYDEPKELGEFHKYRFDRAVPLKRPFQSWGYVYEADT